MIVKINFLQTNIFRFEEGSVGVDQEENEENAEEVDETNGGIVKSSKLPKKDIVRSSKFSTFLPRFYSYFFTSVL